MTFEDNTTTEHPTFVTHLECGMTGAIFKADELHQLSPEGWPMLVRYDLEALGKSLSKNDLANRSADLWRYREFLPVRKAENIVSLGEVMTPLMPLSRCVPAGATVLVKDEGRLPTGSFKARGLALAVSMAKELGITRAAMPTNGNAGAALAAYASKAGIETYVFCPEDTPAVNMAEIALQGAKLYRVNGLINDCGKIVGEGKEAMGWFDVSTLKEPYRIEGKKTMGLELAEQLGWRVPDVIFYPTGGGTGLIGMWKAFAELEAIGWIGSKRPRMVAVQAEGCAPIVKAWEEGKRHAETWVDAHTVASGIRVPAAIGDFLILDAVRQSDGFASAVSDADIEQARTDAAGQDGVLLCPEGAATLAAYRAALESGQVSSDDEVVLHNCGSGLKYPMPEAGSDIDRHKPVDYASM
ncbi:MAG: threonine synthase [Alphaproteobacteria bacterium]|jgi:threonine synthase|nr:threonine synthase [Alphaproteobacteria bacterium]MBT4086652.1 threonine synthase [Alphaproteobacteria bacterium]MBT4545297.1 threonine synthase [Alphaproteobacteria bacterium]MBT6386225.1 threonine synthase [Alphaproteobacteria bacterium]MBT7744481.1 threonine synthase [Alphaproteobacteria bacterium]